MPSPTNPSHYQKFLTDFECRGSDDTEPNYKLYEAQVEESWPEVDSPINKSSLQKIFQRRDGTSFSEPFLGLASSLSSFFDCLRYLCTANDENEVDTSSVSI